MAKILPTFAQDPEQDFGCHNIGILYKILGKCWARTFCWVEMCLLISQRRNSRPNKKLFRKIYKLMYNSTFNTPAETFILNHRYFREGLDWACTRHACTCLRAILSVFTMLFTNPSGVGSDCSRKDFYLFFQKSAWFSKNAAANSDDFNMWICLHTRQAFTLNSANKKI